VQGPKLIIVEDADAGLDVADLDRLAEIGRELADRSGVGIVLIGADLGACADCPGPASSEREMAVVGADAAGGERADTVVIETDGAQA
jgi:ABC-type phosphonate transport system ATPase subunit